MISKLAFVVALSVGAFTGVASAAPLSVEQKACRTAMRSGKPVVAKTLKVCRQGAMIVTLTCDEGKVYVIPAGRDYVVRVGKPAVAVPKGKRMGDVWLTVCQG